MKTVLAALVEQTSQEIMTVVLLVSRTTVQFVCGRLCTPELVCSLRSNAELPSVHSRPTSCFQSLR